VIRISLKGLKPFSPLRVEASCFNVAVGKNGSGKSLFMKTLWSLDRAIASLSSLGGVLSALLPRLAEEGEAERALEDLASNTSKSVKDLFFRHLDELGIAGFLEEDFELTVETESVSVSLSRSGASIELKKAASEELDALERVFDERELKLYFKMLRLIYALKSVLNPCGSSPPKLITDAMGLIGIPVSKLLAEFEYPLYVPDARGGILRCATFGRNPLDIYFVSAINLVKSAASSKNLTISNDVIRDLGAVSYDPAKDEVSYPWGKTKFDDAPSGLKEALPLVLVLEAGIWESFYIEEPEAHLHPSALESLLLYMIEKLEGKKAFVSTHSDFFIYTLNDLIASHRLSEEELKRVWGRPVKGVEPQHVRLLLFKKEGSRVEVRAEAPDEDGLDEEFLEDVMAELERRRVALGALL